MNHNVISSIVLQSKDTAFPAQKMAVVPLAIINDLRAGCQQYLSQPNNAASKTAVPPLSVRGLPISEALWASPCVLLHP